MPENNFPEEEKVDIKKEDIDADVLKWSILEDVGEQNHLYHGTSKENAHYILLNNSIAAGKELSYLGKGVYCYYLDRYAAKDWASLKHKNEKKAIINLTAELGNVLLICNELRQILVKKAEEFIGTNSYFTNVTIGLLIEKLIKHVIDIDINAVSRMYVLKKPKSKQRNATMYCIRGERVRKIALYWEEE
jgi:hypothetical protein